MRHSVWAFLIAAAFVAACAGEPVDVFARSSDDTPPGPGLFTGGEGNFVIYEKVCRVPDGYGGFFCPE